MFGRAFALNDRALVGYLLKRAPVETDAIEAYRRSLMRFHFILLSLFTSHRNNGTNAIAMTSMIVFIVFNVLGDTSLRPMHTTESNL